jgi:uncharacterized protein YqjF (DUF2071 family)
VVGSLKDVMGVVAHRPWALPTGPWVIAQRWNTLLFAHWPVPVATMRALVPSALSVDVRDGSAWVSVTPFYLDALRPHLGPPLPGISSFLEINVRTYVTLDGKPGVYFFSLDASSAIAVRAARLLYHLPYQRAAMRLRAEADGMIAYESRRQERLASPAVFHGRYRATGPVSHSAPGSLDHWLTERYCLYALDWAQHLYRAEIHHVPWPLQPAELEIGANSMALAAGITLPAQAPRLAFAERLDVAVWPPVRVDRAEADVGASERVAVRR